MAINQNEIKNGSLPWLADRSDGLQWGSTPNNRSSQRGSWHCNVGHSCWSWNRNTVHIKGNHKRLQIKYTNSPFKNSTENIEKIFQEVGPKYRQTWIPKPGLHWNSLHNHFFILSVPPVKTLRLTECSLKLWISCTIMVLCTMYIVHHGKNYEYLCYIISFIF